MHQVTLLLALCALVALVGCQKRAATSDSTPPKLHLSNWEKNESGGQGVQKTIYPAGQTEVQNDWLGPNKADITVYGEDDEGVRKVEVSGSATGKCVAKEGDQFWNAPSLLSASFSKRTETVDQGYVKDFIAFHLDELMANRSCGTHQYSGMDKAREFFMTSGTWTISAHAENCCGGQTDGTFTIVVK